ncbi:hypothetical protein GCM10022284_04050 [Streptomyces hundungensis]
MLTRYRCDQYNTIHTSYRSEISALDERTLNHPNDDIAKSCHVMSQGARSGLARRLNKHMAYCKLCR